MRFYYTVVTTEGLIEVVPSLVPDVFDQRKVGAGVSTDTVAYSRWVDCVCKYGQA